GGRRLACAAAAPGAGLDVVGAAADGGEAERELAERIAAELGTEHRLQPRRATVERDADLADALAAVERDAADDRRTPGRDALAVRERSDERAHREAGDRPRLRRRCAGSDADAIVVGNTVPRSHPEALERVIDDLDVRQVLDPVRAVAAGDDELHG